VTIKEAQRINRKTMMVKSSEQRPASIPVSPAGSPRSLENLRAHMSMPENKSNRYSSVSNLTHRSPEGSPSRSSDALARMSATVASETPSQHDGNHGTSGFTTAASGRLTASVGDERRRVSDADERPATAPALPAMPASPLAQVKLVARPSVAAPLVANRVKPQLSSLPPPPLLNLSVDSAAANLSASPSQTELLLLSPRGDQLPPPITTSPAAPTKQLAGVAAPLPVPIAKSTASNTLASTQR
jgi:hypothetical protein